MDVSASLETTADDLFETELKKKVFVNVPINFKEKGSLFTFLLIELQQNMFNLIREVKKKK